MKDGDTLALALVLWAWSSGAGAGARRGGNAPAPAPRPDAPRAEIGEGWWWYWYPTDVAGQVQHVLAKELRRANRLKERRRWEIRKTMGGTALGATVIVFYVFEPFRWELPGLPEPAPRGLDTDLSDVAGVIPEPPSVLRKLAAEVAKQTWEYLRQLYENRRPPREPFP